MTTQEILESLKSLKKGQFGIKVVTITTPKMNKKGNDLFGRVSKKSIIKNAILGVSYQNCVRNKSQKLTGEVSNFESEKPLGKHFIKGYENALLASDADENVQYLRINFNGGTHTEIEYFVDGRTATDAEVEIIKAFSQKKSNLCETQRNEGLTEETAIVVRDYKVDSIVAIE